MGSVSKSSIVKNLFEPIEKQLLLLAGTEKEVKGIPFVREEIQRTCGQGSQPGHIFGISSIQLRLPFTRQTF